jgi:hypothetical protein
VTERAGQSLVPFQFKRGGLGIGAPVLRLSTTQVRSDPNVLVGSGDVIIQSVTP